MPAEQPEQQLVLLEDQVFDFDDIDSGSAAGAPADAASAEAQDTRQMIASMLDQQPLMSVDTSPAAYLEYLRIIFNCGKLLQPAMPRDLQQSVAALLAKAKSLFCANSFSLIAQTVSAISSGSSGGAGGPPMPAFWGETFSQHECLEWVELMETVLFFWSESDPTGLRARLREDVVVEAFAVGRLSRLCELRAAYADAACVEDLAAVLERGRRAEQLARDIRRRLRPQQLLALAGAKKGQEKLLLPALSAFDCFLEAAGALPEPAASSLARTRGPALARTKTALEGVTFEQMRAALRLHRPAHFGAAQQRLQRLRERHLTRPELRETPGRLRDLLGASAAAAGCKDPELPEFLATYVEYATACADFELRWQRSVVKDAGAIGPFLLPRLRSLVAMNIVRAKGAGCWDSLPEELQTDLQRQSERRLSALTEARPEEAAGASGGCLTFELEIVASNGGSRGFCPQLVLPTVT